MWILSDMKSCLFIVDTPQMFEMTLLAVHGDNDDNDDDDDDGDDHKPDHD